MFVGSGDNITIVANKDYKEHGLITPLFEKLPEIDYVTIDSPYGKLEVTSDTYKLAGKEKLIAEQKAFLDFRNELIKAGKIDPSVSSSDTNDSISAIKVTENSPTALTAPLVQTDSLAPMLTTQEFVNKREDLCFTAKSGMQPYYIYGRATPYTANPRYPDSTLASYHEYEIDLNSQGDIIELISQHNNSGTGMHVWFFIYDNAWTPNEFKRSSVGFMNVNGPIEFYFMDDIWTHVYELYVYNPSTRESRIDHYTDNTPGSSISGIDASTELQATVPNTWYDKSVLEMWVAASGHTYYNPTDVFDMGTVNPKSQYVEVKGEAVNGHYVTTHEDGGSVP